MDIWYAFWSVGVFFLVLIHCTKENQATLNHSSKKLFSGNFAAKGFCGTTLSGSAC
jgi:hypothetical protein